MQQSPYRFCQNGAPCILVIFCNGYYALAVLAVLLLTDVVALLQPKLPHAVQKYVLSPHDHDGDTSASDYNQQDVHDQHLDSLFELSQAIANSGGIGAALFGHKMEYMTGPVNAVVFLLVLCLYIHDDGHNSESCVSTPCHLPGHGARGPHLHHGYNRHSRSTTQSYQVVLLSQKDAHHALRMCYYIRHIVMVSVVNSRVVLFHSWTYMYHLL